MGVEDRTEPIRIGVVEEENEYLSRLGKAGDEVAISLWREVCEQLNNYLLTLCLSASLSLSVSLCLSLSLCLSVSKPFCHFVFQSFISFCLSVFILPRWVFLPVCLFVSLSLWLSLSEIFMCKISFKNLKNTLLIKNLVCRSPRTAEHWRKRSQNQNFWLQRRDWNSVFKFGKVVW